MAMVCCGRCFEMAAGVFVLCSMDPINVLKHCHNNGWLSLPHNKSICHFWQHSGGKKEAGGQRGMAMVCCGRCFEMAAGVFVLCSMDPINVLKHCHNNGWLSLPHNKSICHFWQHQCRKKGGRRPKRYGHGVLWQVLGNGSWCVCAVFHGPYQC